MVIDMGVDVRKWPGHRIKMTAVICWHFVEGDESGVCGGTGLL